MKYCRALVRFSFEGNSFFPAGTGICPAAGSRFPPSGGACQKHLPASRPAAVGQVIGIAFCLLYGFISWHYAYYGEMITYLGMTFPMSVVTLVIWLRNPYNGDRMCVQVNRLRPLDLLWLAVVTAAVTVVFGFLLRALNTANLVPSIVSISTSTIAVYLSWRRSPWFAVGYALNDLVLIVLWALAAAEDPGAVSMLMCFIAFLANDLYGFRNWRRMLRQQTA